MPCAMTGLEAETFRRELYVNNFSKCWKHFHLALDRPREPQLARAQDLISQSWDGVVLFLKNTEGKAEAAEMKQKCWFENSAHKLNKLLCTAGIANAKFTLSRAVNI